MMADCCAPTSPGNNPIFRRALKIALAVNLTMLVVELVAGATSGSTALLADALDFFGDSANYIISLAVLGLAPLWHTRAAMLKGATLLLLGLGVFIYTAWQIQHGRMPEPITMGVVAVAACIANLGVALMLYRFRDGDANMQSVWVCSRNDAVGNLAVLFAALGVFGTGTPWPDLLVAGIMSGLSVSAGVRILISARAEQHQRRGGGCSAGHQPGR
ncbi:cation transporter [Marinobacter sp. JSM 1782161]|uniref:cation transporter n=1 Tax=Marinobacter sp. JSM 1782161 TaxID=2685906 RepID=UPI0014030216